MLASVGVADGFEIDVFNRVDTISWNYQRIVSQQSTVHSYTEYAYRLCLRNQEWGQP